MTQEEKQLLLKDLCTRLPYNIKVGVTYNKEHGSSNRLKLCSEGCLMLNINILNLYIEDEIYLKPYLRPMSSMTDEEREEWTDLFNSELDKLMSIEDEKQAEYLAPNYFASSHSASVDWLNKKMFDYRKLIPMGFAIEAPEGMYDTKTEYYGTI